MSETFIDWFVQSLPGCLLAVSLLLLAVYDVRTFLLPNILTYGLLGFGLGFAVLDGWPVVYDRLIGAVLGGAGLLIVAVGYKWLRGRDGLGMGDVKLFAAGGAWVGPQGLASILVVAGPVTLLVAFFAALIKNNKLKKDQPLPFGVGLAVGIWLVWFWGPIETWVL